MDRLLGAMQQLQVAVTENPRPPAGSPNKSFVSPLAHGRRSNAAAAVTVTTRGASSSRGSSAPSILDLLVPSNSDGRDDSGYFVPPRHTAFNMVRDFFGIPLGSVIADGTECKIQWHEAAKWRPQTSDPSQNSRNIEGKKFMKLFAYIATVEEVGKMAALAPEDPVALAACLESKRTAIDDVIGRLMQYLEEHERFLPTTGEPKKKGGPKKSTVGALSKRWGGVNNALHHPNEPLVASGSILRWSAVGSASASAASASASSAVVSAVVCSTSASVDAVRASGTRNKRPRVSKGKE